mmetsp:Transcript_11293/g.19013  ORF Transcript_11293/g.19013 Transcript_11293/m.19013 type:complete len:93 (+) Transcript_11293:67-345(+)
MTDHQFDVTYRCYEEIPYMNKYHKSHETGIYKSAASGEVLFSSNDKINYGGRPTFTKAINPKVLAEEKVNNSFGHKWFKPKKFEDVKVLNCK